MAFGRPWGLRLPRPLNVVPALAGTAAGTLALTVPACAELIADGA
jgi:hypothetical protein